VNFSEASVLTYSDASTVRYRHRSVVVSLDIAFALIEGHPRKARRSFTAVGAEERQHRPTLHKSQSLP
jgi:hypothetical protein